MFSANRHRNVLPALTLMISVALCQQRGLGAEKPNWETIAGQDAEVMADKDTDYIWRHLELNLANGTILVRTTRKPIVVRTTRSTITLASNSLASIYDNDGTEDTFIVLGKADIEVSGVHKVVKAGYESAVLKPDTRLPREAAIRRMEVCKTQLPDSKLRIAARFSTPDLFASDALLRTLAQSESVTDQDLVKRISQRK